MSEITHFTGTMIRVRMIGGQARSGEPGKSSYELAVQNGYQGTLQQWLNERRGQGGAANIQDYAQTFEQNRNSTHTQTLAAYEEQESSGENSLVSNPIKDFVNKRQG